MIEEYEPFRFESERLILRRLAERDLNILLAYRNDPEVARYQSWESMSEYEAREYIEEQQLISPIKTGKWFQFAIELKEAGVMVGDCGFKRSATEPRQAEIGYTIAREYHRRGIGFEAVSLLVDILFRELKLHRITATTDCKNTASNNLLERLGMRQEGHYIENTWFKGSWGDEYLYAMLAREWLKHKS